MACKVKKRRDEVTVPFALAILEDVCFQSISIFPFSPVWIPRSVLDVPGPVLAFMSASLETIHRYLR